MSKTYIFGHKNPDTDTVISSIAVCDLERKLGNDVEAIILGSINKETKYVLDYFNIAVPALKTSLEESTPVILVDHNEFSQSIDGIEKLSIKKVIDHHKIGNFFTSEPLYYRAEPVGCTATIVYKLYKEANVVVDAKIAGLLLSAIVSDTLLLKSPTTTNYDREALEELSKIANVDLDKYGVDMLKAGADLSDLTESELIAVDIKEFDLNGIKSEIGQVNTVDIDDIMLRKQKIEEAMKQRITDKNLGLILIAITDVLESNSQIIALGDRTDIVKKAYNIKLENNTEFIPGLVSRKKQIVPVLMENS